MMLEPDRMDWENVDDSTVYYAANDGIPEAIAEQQRRELARRTAPNQTQSE
jgi:hypothetical protein